MMLLHEPKPIYLWHVSIGELTSIHLTYYSLIGMERKIKEVVDTEKKCVVMMMDSVEFTQNPQVRSKLVGMLKDAQAHVYMIQSKTPAWLG